MVPKTISLVSVDTGPAYTVTCKDCGQRVLAGRTPFRSKVHRDTTIRPTVTEYYCGPCASRYQASNWRNML